MRVGYSRKMKWFILCVVAVLVSQGMPNCFSDLYFSK